jgi:hypothetical protein
MGFSAGWVKSSIGKAVKLRDRDSGQSMRQLFLIIKRLFGTNKQKSRMLAVTTQKGLER